MQIERQNASSRPEMRYLSYYGYAHALAYGSSLESIRACETAARREFYNPELHLNLARVYAMSDKTTRALAALETGLRYHPDHAGLRAELVRLDRRAPPALGFLSRDHAVNVWLGRSLGGLLSRRSHSSISSRVAGAS
jgi:hypothetical protein